MATAVQDFSKGRPDLSGRMAANSRNRIIAAAADVLRVEPEGFSVQRAARQAGLSARAVYGHFESGAELVHTARLSMLEAITDKLPSNIDRTAPPDEALQQFAQGIAAALQPLGLTWLLAARQDASFRLEYQRLLRRPLIHELEVYIHQRQAKGMPAACSHSKLAELMITTIESIVVNYDPELTREVNCAESLNELVRALCKANAI